MSSPAPFSRRFWLLIPLCAVLFVLATDYGRVRQVGRVRDIDREGSSETAYAGGRHWLIVPEHHARSYQWMLETEQMLTRGEGRVREVAYENAPLGRAVHSASPYRWWLGLVAWTDHTLSGRPIPQSVEQAALWSGPLLHLLLLLGGTVYATRRFGVKSGALISVGLAGLYPLAGEFLPGVPDDHGLAISCAWGCALLLIAGLNGHRASFILSGVAGGLGLWISAATQVPVLGAIGAGALLLSLYGRITSREYFQEGKAPLPWGNWALAGAVTSLLAYLAEYYPGHMEMRLEVNHPVYGLAWMGLGLLLTLVESWRCGSAGWNRRTIFTALGAFAGLAALPAAMTLTDSPAFLVANADVNRLTNLLDGPVAPNFATWLVRDGSLLAKVAACLPLALLVPAVLALLARATDRATKRSAAFLGGVLLVCFAIACTQLQGWALTQLMLLTLLAVVLPLTNLRSGLTVTVCLLPGLIMLANTARPRDDSRLSRLEIEGLVERDIAHWLADRTRTEADVVLVSPERTPSLVYFGGLRGLGSPNWENSDGVAVTIRIIDATTSEEAQALLSERGVTHIVLPSWDADLDEFVRWTKSNPNDTFLAALRRWALPPWLQPLAYRLPGIAGFEGQSVTILQVTDNTDRALAASRLAEYFLEVQNLELAASVNETLKTFPANLGALIGRAQVEKTRANTAAFDAVFAGIQQTLTNGLDRLLPWDRRVSLAVVLAQGGRNDAARAQLQRCLAEMDEARLRSLSAGALYRLLVLSKAFDLTLKPELRAPALALLPAEARARL